MLAPVPVASILTEAEKEEFARCEETIRRGWQSFVEVGEALNTIHDQKLYRDRYERFEDYYRDVWQYQKSQVYRLMGAAKVVRVLSPIGEKAAAGLPQPLSEAQVRPLVGLKDAEIKKAWQKVTQEAKGEKITARLVQKQVRAIVPQAKKSAGTAGNNPSQDRPDHVTVIKEALDELMVMIGSDKSQLARAAALQQQIMRLVQRHTT